jgi:hypothetical protein
MAIKIPEQVYVGFQGRRTQDEVPLGFMTPYNDDEAGQKRRDTVDNWARGYGSTKTFNSVILDNKPMIGFKIGRAIRRSGGWNGSGASYVRIEDPRGFELEITIENLVMCMNENLLDDGEIIAECVWGRDGNRNILLPTNSEPYKNSVVLRTKVAAVIPLKEVTIGDEVELVTGERGIYLGNMLALHTDGNLSYRRSSLKIEEGAKRYVVKVVKNGKPYLVGRPSIKVIEVTKKAEKKLTVAEIENEVISAMALNRQACEDLSAHGYRPVVAYVLSGYTVGLLSEVDITEAEIKQEVELHDGYRQPFSSFVEADDGKKYYAEHHLNFKMDRQDPDRCYWAHSPNSGNSWNNSVRTQATGLVVREIDHVGRSLATKYEYATEIPESSAKRFYLMHIDITTKAGNTIKGFV